MLSISRLLSFYLSGQITHVNLLAKIIATFRPLGLLQAMLTKLNKLNLLSFVSIA